MRRKAHYIGDIKDAIRSNSNHTPKMQAKLQGILSELRKRGLSDFEKLGGGHTGTPVYSCTTETGERKVAKIGLGRTKYEVDANLYGYRSLASMGLQDFIPNFRALRISDTHIILIDNVGISFREAAGEDREDLYPKLARKIKEVCARTVSDAQEPITGINEFLENIRSWYKILRDSGIITTGDLGKILKIEAGPFAGKRSAVMLLDFTPDNIFIDGGAIKHIDPWYQKTYLGSPIMSISVFINLSDHVYNLPGASANRRRFISLASGMGRELGLTKKQIDMQLGLGEALQCGLSSYTRRDKDRKTASVYAERGVHILSDILEDSYRYKTN